MLTGELSHYSTMTSLLCVTHAVSHPVLSYIFFPVCLLHQVKSHGHVSYVRSRSINIILHQVINISLTIGQRPIIKSLTSGQDPPTLLLHQVKTLQPCSYIRSRPMNFSLTSGQDPSTFLLRQLKTHQHFKTKVNRHSASP